MKVNAGSVEIGVTMQVDAEEFLKKVQELAAADSVSIDATLDLKSLSERKLMWLRQGNRDFFRMNRRMESLFLSLISIDDTLKNSELVEGAEKQLKAYLVARFEKPDVEIEPLKPSTLENKRAKGQPLIPGIATRDLLNDIKKADMDIKVVVGAGGRKKIKTP